MLELFKFPLHYMSLRTHLPYLYFKKTFDLLLRLKWYLEIQFSDIKSDKKLPIKKKSIKQELSTIKNQLMKLTLQEMRWFATTY